MGGRWRGVGRIVCNWDGTPMHHDTPSKQFRAFADKHGFEGVRFHDLRHTHATLLFASNIDAVAVATRLGHAKADTTLRIYAHALKRRDEDSAQAMQTFLDLVNEKPPDEPKD
jgi:integrase